MWSAELSDVIAAYTCLRIKKRHRVVSCDVLEQSRTFCSTVICNENPNESLTLTLEAIISQISDDVDAESTVMMMTRPSGTPTSSCIGRRLFAACIQPHTHVVSLTWWTLRLTSDSYINLVTIDCHYFACNSVFHTKESHSRHELWRSDLSWSCDLTWR